MNRISSFKVKLVVYFVVLSLLPLTAAFFGFSSVSKRSEERRIDARAQAGLRAAVTAYGDQLTAAEEQATQLARSPEVQNALRGGNRSALRHIAGTLGADVRFGPGTRVQVPPLSAARTVAVYSGRRLLGHVAVIVHVNDELLRHIRRRTGLDRVDQLIGVERDRVVLGGSTLHGRVLRVPVGRTEVLDVGGVGYRALAAEPLSEPSGLQLAVLTPQSLASRAASATQRRLMTALLTALLLTAIVAYVLSRSVVQRLRHLAGAAMAIAGGHLGQRVPVQGRDEFAALGRSFNDMAGQLEARVGELETARRRLREAIDRFGEALEATHNPAHLRQVIVESAVEATGASGGLIETEGEGEPVRTGDCDPTLEALELPLHAGSRSFGRLVLYGKGFDEDARDVATSLAGQAVIALDNARLHAIVERQALVDALTGLANRRRSDQMLHLELSRAIRLEAPLAFVLADVDHFKSVNDEFGHPAGDAVLRKVAALFTEALREIDVAGRWGGEEFALILPGTDLEGGLQLAERLRAALATRPLRVDQAEIRVTASFGVASFPEHVSERAIVAAADAALYEAKRSGRNRVVADGAVPA
jgi:diguanylate cyclase (GGDEF)-like protein